MPLPLFTDVSKEDIEALISGEVREDRYVEYKEALPGGTDSDKKEFLADVSSFANTHGGHVVYGIVEKRDESGKATGIPQVAEGVATSNRGQDELRLDTIQRSGLSPRLPSVRFQWVEGFNRGPVLVAHVRQSWARPHMITFQDWARFYTRGANGKYVMDVPQIRSAFAFGGDLAQRLSRFQDERLTAILVGETPVPLPQVPKIVLHQVPASVVDPATQIDIHEAAAQNENLAPMHRMGWNPRYNMDGFLTWGGTTTPLEYQTYVQVFRNGSIEAVCGNLLRPSSTDPLMPSAVVGWELISATDRFLRIQRNLGVQLPVFLLISLLGVKGLIVTGRSGSRDLHPIERDLIQLPDVLVEDYSVETQVVLRPALDALWQASGTPVCPFYDGSGRWIGFRD